MSSRELEELAQDAGAADVPSSDRNQLVARLDAASRARQGQETALWFDARQLQLFDADSGRSLLADGAAASATAPAGTG